jgi:molybdopterin-guanine dinucleotide biosynthesis protein A
VRLGCAGILAGGRSARMGADKALFRIAGRTLLERTVAVVAAAHLRALVVGRAPPEAWASPDCRFLVDEHPGAGPLPAIIQLLRALPGEDVLVLSCDLPRLEPASLALLAEAWAGMPEAHGLVATIADQLQPLAAVYAAAALPALAAAWGGGERSVRRVLEREPRVRRLALPPAIAATFADCDTPEDWRSLSADGPSGGPGDGPPG